MSHKPAQVDQTLTVDEEISMDLLTFEKVLAQILTRLLAEGNIPDSDELKEETEE